MASHSNFKGVFENIRERIEEKAQQSLTDMLPTLAFLTHEYAKEEMKKNKMSSMTGNFINSFGIALYKDGRFVAIGTSHDEEGKSPIRLTLASGDSFEQWEIRYEGRKQYHKFIATEGTHRIFANDEVVNWLRRYAPTKKKGFSFRAVSVVDYSQTVGGDRVLLRLAEDIENSGGIISQFHLG